jgi:menaquinone-9 beta-reductase
MRADVMVIGGGPAGLAAAIAARLKGFDVAVADGRRPPIDRACGEGILPAGVDALRRLGVTVSAEGLAFRGIRFFNGAQVVEASFGAACGVALRRTRLHELLVQRASDLGVRLLWDTPVGSTTGLAECRWTVGADGQNSGVRQEARLDGALTFSTRFGFRRHYQLTPWTDVVEVYWGARCQMYVTPVAPDEIGVALLTRDSHMRLDEALHEFPALERRLRRAACSSQERGAATTSRRLRSVVRGRTALIGDASGSVDAITGDGLSLAFLQAEALAEAMAANNLSLYQAEHRRLMRKPATMSTVLLTLDRSQRLRRMAFAALAFEPSIFNQLLALHAQAK